MRKKINDNGCGTILQPFFMKLLYNNVEKGLRKRRIHFIIENVN